MAIRHSTGNVSRVIQPIDQSTFNGANVPSVINPNEISSGSFNNVEKIMTPIAETQPQEFVVQSPAEQSMYNQWGISQPSVDWAAIAREREERLERIRQERETAKRKADSERIRQKANNEKKIVSPSFMEATSLLENQDNASVPKQQGLDALFVSTENTEATQKAEPSVLANLEEKPTQFKQSPKQRNKQFADDVRVRQYEELSPTAKQFVSKPTPVVSEKTRSTREHPEETAPKTPSNEPPRGQEPSGKASSELPFGSNIIAPEDIEYASDVNDYMPNGNEVHSMLDDVRDWIFTEGFNLPKEETKGKSPDEIANILEKESIELAISQNILENPDRKKGPLDEYPTIREQNQNPDIEAEAPTRQDEYQINLEQRQQEMIDFMLNAFVRLKVDGMKWTKDEATHTWIREIPNGIQPYIAKIRNMYRCSVSDVFSLVVARSGLGIDSEGKLPGHSEKWVMTQNEFKLICDQIIRSQNDYHTPMHIVAEDRLRIGGTRCFPMGYLPRSLVKAITQDPKSILNKEGMTPDKLLDKMHEDWIKSTLPSIYVNTQGDERQHAQRMALDNMMRAMLAFDGYDGNQFEKWGISEAVYATYESIMQDKVNAQVDMAIEAIDQVLPDRKTDYSNKTDDVMKAMRYEVANAREAEFTRLTNRLVKNNKLRRGYVDKYGKYIPYKRRHVTDACNAIATWERFAGVVGNPPIMVSGWLEHAQGNINAKVANAAYGWLVSVGDGQVVRRAYKITKYLTNVSKTKEASTTYGIIERLYRMGGVDAVKAFGMGLTSKHFEMTPQGVAKFIDEYIRPQQKENPGKFATVAKNIDTWYRDLMEGSFGLRGADCKRFFEMALVNNSIAEGCGMPSINAQELEEIIEHEGIGTAIMKVASTDEGFDAILSTSNMNLGRKSPLSYAVDRSLNRFGISNVLITTFFETYFTYGVNLVQLYMPLSNTVSYLTVCGFTGKHGSGQALQYQLGGYHFAGDRTFNGFLTGLMENLIYDTAKIGNTLGIACLYGAFILLMGGLQPPEDKKDWANWLEWRIGIKGEGLAEIIEDIDEYKDDDGNLYIPAWWMNDLTTYGLPLAVAWHAQKQHPEKPWLGLQLVLDGTGSMLEGSSLLDFTEVIAHPEEHFDILQRSINGDGYLEKPESWDSRMRMMAWGAVDDLTRKSTPAVLRDYFFPRNVKDTLFVGQEARQHTSSYVYDTVNYTAEEARKYNRKVAVDDYEEQQLRGMAKNNPVLAILLNITRNGYILDNGHNDKTGYLFEEMPISTMKDQVRSSWAEMFNSDLDNPLLNTPENKELWEQERNRSFLQMIEVYEQYDGNVNQFLADGGMLPAEERISAIVMAYDLIEQSEAEYTQYLIDTGQAYDAIANGNKKAIQSAYYDLINNWLSNDEIPWRDDGYELLISDWEPQYYIKDTNVGVDYFTWLTNADNTEKRYVPRGNSKTSWLPFTVVHSNAYNEETPSSWFVPGVTDTQKVYDMLSDVEAIVPYGRDSGQYTVNSAFGGPDDFTHMDRQASPSELNIAPGSMESTTLNYRSYVPVQDNVPLVLTDDQIRRYGLASIFGLRNEGTYGASPTSNGNSSGNGSGSGSGNGTGSGSGDGAGNGSNGTNDGNGANGGTGSSNGNDNGKKPNSMDGIGRSIYDLSVELIAQAHGNPTIAELRAIQNDIYNGIYGGGNGSGAGSRAWNRFYGGNRSYYRSGYVRGGYSSNGGSSTYNPKIYSNPARIYTNRAQGLNTHQPYKATTTYLRPGFETKGSREAYKRSDI